ncbi:hypothetical protein BKA56DRAFT_524444 [Ilyonectria sp. MPI-CAGE-AT-0026]|nr:hypothetical protein BKA56DRAFT_524444 [Ilyonectria sp. MPI-CAGE-AT-0026]
MASPQSSTCQRATAANDASPSTTARRDPDTVTTRQLKKRELDRKAQRLARERTKTRITSLEKLVADLQHKDTSDQVRALTKSLQAVTKERDVALGLLKSLGSSINQHLSQSQDAVTFDSTTSSCNRKSPDTTMDDAETAPVHSVTDDFNVLPNDGTTGNGAIQAQQGPRNPICSLQHPEVPEFITPPTDAVGSLLDDLLPGFPPVDNILETIPNDGNDPISPASMPGCGCYPQDQLRASSDSLNLWRFANEVLSAPSQLNRDSADFDETWQDDLPVRAVVEGWSAAEAKLGRLPALWLKLRPIDEVLFHGCGKAERVAMLRIMHDLLLYHLDPSTERRATIPPWYLERPSQAISHSYAINFFAWPGIRERFVFYQHSYCGNIFWHLFSQSLRLRWPYEFRDTYSMNTETGQFVMSDAFKKRIKDINVWAMKSQMFDQWPEFYCDIPAFDSLPMSLGFKPLPTADENTDQPATDGRNVEIETHQKPPKSTAVST